MMRSQDSLTFYFYYVEKALKQMVKILAGRLALVLQQAGLPVEGVALIIGVDRFLDMVRTMVNVTGDATVATIVAHQEGQLDQDIYLDPNADHDGDLEDPQTTGAAA